MLSLVTTKMLILNVLPLNSKAFCSWVSSGNRQCFSKLIWSHEYTPSLWFLSWGLQSHPEPQRRSHRPDTWALEQTPGSFPPVRKVQFKLPICRNERATNQLNRRLTQTQLQSHFHGAAMRLIPWRRGARCCPVLLVWDEPSLR